MREEEQCQNDTVQFSLFFHSCFFYFNFIFILFMGYPKIGYNNHYHIFLIGVDGTSPSKTFGVQP